MLKYDASDLECGFGVGFGVGSGVGVYSIAPGQIALIEHFSASYIGGQFIKLSNFFIFYCSFGFHVSIQRLESLLYELQLRIYEEVVHSFSSFIYSTIGLSTGKKPQNCF